MRVESGNKDSNFLDMSQFQQMVTRAELEPNANAQEPFPETLVAFLSQLNRCAYIPADANKH